MQRGDAVLSKVGNSNRTLGKHTLLNRVLGREVGIMVRGRPSFISPEYTMLDLCAGDGRDSSSGTCSPKILEKHYRFLKQRGLQAQMVLVEKNRNAYDELLKRKLPGVHICEDATKISSYPVHRNGAVFVHADPNHVEDWPISAQFLRDMPRCTTLLVTLGCNVGGIKRLPITAREKWFARMDELLQNLPAWHDALLVALRGDSAQWAYLITGPSKWQERYRLDAVRSFDYWKPGIECVRFGKDEQAFYRIRDRLFLTAKEVESVGS